MTRPPRRRDRPDATATTTPRPVIVLVAAAPKGLVPDG
jgi:hypothetical protein